jgi:hypothetical protein
VNDFLTDKHILYHLAFAESNVDHKWVTVKFSDESTFCSAHHGLDLVFRPHRQHYNHQYMSSCKHSGSVSAQFWDCISHEGPGNLHRIHHLDGLQYKHILQNAMVPSVQMLYLDGIQSV